MSSPTAEGGRSARRRRLSAIVQADLSGYVRLMEGDEDRTVSRLKSVRAEIWLPAVDAAGGRIVNIVGDSVLAEFSSAVAAVAAAIDIQERMARFNDALVEEQRLMFRIGLHLGEVVVDETETIFGDAVNVASRIQLMAEPGGIAASQEIRDATHLLSDCTFVDGGKYRARHVRRPLQIYHVHRRGSASGALARKMGVTLRRSALWGTIAAIAVLLAGGGYLAFTANPTAPVSTAALTLSAEQLEQALAERRKADALAAEKRQLEAQARQRADTEAEAKRRADVELGNARQARQKAERELAQLKADIEARRRTEIGRDDQSAVIAQRATEEAAQRKAEAEAASLREAEEAAAKKAEADAANKQQADQALAVATDRGHQAEAEARAAAAKTAPTLPTLKEQAEAAERDLRLVPTDRRRLQIALTSLGFDTHGDDGVFGPRSREMIANWQKAHNQPPTGFVTKAQQQALLQEAAAALSKADEQKKAKEGIPPATEASAAPPARASESTDGLWRGTYECGRNGNFKPFTLKPEVRLKAGNGTWYTAYGSATNDNTLGISVAIDGTKVRVTRRTTSSGGSITSGANADTSPLFGWLEGNAILASNNKCTMVLVRDVAPLEASPAQPASPQSELADGLWRGTYECGRNGNLKPLTLRPEVQLKNGTGTWFAISNSPTNDFTIGINISVDGAGVRVTRQSLNYWTAGGHASAAPLLGRFEGNAIQASGNGCTMVLTRDVSPARAAIVSQPLPAAYHTTSFLPSPDGLWRGTYKCEDERMFGPPFTIGLELQLTNGSARWRTEKPDRVNGFSFDVGVSVVRDIASVARGIAFRGGLGSQATLTGRYDGASINARGRENPYGRDCTLALTRS
jgi:class 3 adenylate cyclase/peptidoglycan hydrolase-like protein with peptidoglycan-binding domain